MIVYALLIAPLLALWLWLPVQRSRRFRALAVLLTTALGLLPLGLLTVLRQGWLAESTLVPAQVFGGWVMGLLLLALPLLLLRDAGWLAHGLFARLAKPRAANPHTRQHANPSARSPSKWPAIRWHDPHLTLALLGLAGLLSAWGVMNGLRPPELREHDVRMAQLPPELDGLRVAVLADIHATPINNARHVQAMVDRVNTARADLIVLPGDMADGDAALGAANVAPLTQLRAPFGVWAAPGNHEYYNGYAAWAKVFKAMNLAYLENQTRIIDIRGKRVAISGVGDPAYGRLSRHNQQPDVAEGLPPDVDAVVQQAAGADFHLLLAHQPKQARANAAKGGPAPASEWAAPTRESGQQPEAHRPAEGQAAQQATQQTASQAAGKAVDLQISGHTHGGHVCGMDQWLIAPANDGFVRGLYPVGPVGGMQLFVSSGAGLWAGFPIRLGVPSAIEVLVLRRG